MDSGPVLSDGGFWTSSIHVYAGADRLVLSQGPSVMMQIIVWLVLFIIAFATLAFVAAAVTTNSQHLVCDRATGMCTYGERPLAPITDIKEVYLDRQWSRANGTFYGIVLKLHDGSKREAYTYAAQEKRSVEEYRAVVDAMRAFLADPAQTKLDRTYVYRLSVMEIVLAIVRTLVMLMIATFLILAWNRRSYTFDRAAGKITASSKGFMRRAQITELPFDRVTSIVDQKNQLRRYLELQLADGTRVTIAQSRKGAVDPLPAQVSQIIGKPIETRR